MDPQSVWVEHEEHSGTAGSISVVRACMAFICKWQTATKIIGTNSMDSLKKHWYSHIMFEEKESLRWVTKVFILSQVFQNRAGLQLPYAFCFRLPSQHANWNDDPGPYLNVPAMFQCSELFLLATQVSVTPPVHFQLTFHTFGQHAINWLVCLV